MCVILACACFSWRLQWLLCEVCVSVCGCQSQRTAPARFCGSVLTKIAKHAQACSSGPQGDTSLLPCYFFFVPIDVFVAAMSLASARIICTLLGASSYCWVAGEHGSVPTPGRAVGGLHKLHGWQGGAQSACGQDIAHMERQPFCRV